MNRFALVTATLGLCFAAGCVKKSKYLIEKTRADRLAKELYKERRLTADQKKRLGQLEQAIAKVKAALEDRNQDLTRERQLGESYKKKIASLETDLSNLKNEVGAKNLKLDRFRKAIQELEKIKAKVLAQENLNRKLLAAFKGMISAGKLKVERVGGRLVIKMASKVLFQAGKADVTKIGEGALQQIAQILSKVNRHFQIAGHTDNIPIRRSRYNDNWELSAVRAVKVLRLLEKFGVPKANLSAAGYGALQPSHSNRSWRGRAQNRRIEITLYPVIPRRVR